MLKLRLDLPISCCKRTVGMDGGMQGTVGNPAEELTSSHRASSEEAEQTDASMLERRTNIHTPEWHHQSCDLLLVYFSKHQRCCLLCCLDTLKIKAERKREQADRKATHSEGEVRSQRRRVEVLKDGVLEVRELQTCTKRSVSTEGHVTELWCGRAGFDSGVSVLTSVRASATLLHFFLQSLHLVPHLPAPLLRLLQLTAHREAARWMSR